jgi:hypothetical protein
MAFKTQRFIYTSRNNETGLTDVKATIRKDGIEVAGPTHGPGSSDDRPVLSEIGGGRYELVMNHAAIVAYGGAGYYDFHINSASKPAGATVGRQFSENDSDTLAADLAVIGGKIDNIDLTVDSIKAAVDDGTSGLAALKAFLVTIGGYTDQVEGMLTTQASTLTSISNAIAALPDQASIDQIINDLATKASQESVDTVQETLDDRLYTGGQVV